MPTTAQEVLELMESLSSPAKEDGPQTEDKNAPGRTGTRRRVDEDSD